MLGWPARRSGSRSHAHTSWGSRNPTETRRSSRLTLPRPGVPVNQRTRTRHPRRRRAGHALRRSLAWRSMFAWRFLDHGGSEVGASERFPDRESAESWMGETWSDLHERGVEEVVLVDE